MTDFQLLESATSQTANQMLASEVECPGCNTLLQLSLNERLNKGFDCPECKTHINMNNGNIIAENIAGHDAATISFHPMSIAKLVVMTICTFGLYQIYWFYRNWQAVKIDAGEELSPIWRAIFSPFFCHDLFVHVKELAISKGINVGYSSAWLTSLFIVFRIVGRFPGSWGWLGFASLLVLIPVQKAINATYSERKAGSLIDSRYSGLNVAGIVAGGVLLLFALLGSFLPDASDERVQVKNGSYVSNSGDRELVEFIELEVG